MEAQAGVRCSTDDAMRPVGINEAVQRALPDDVIDVAADCPRSGDGSPHLHDVDGPVVGSAPLTTEEALASASHAADAGRRTNDGLNDVHQVAGAWDPADLEGLGLRTSCGRGERHQG